MHYALVSDLMTREEFEERVEEKSAALGGVVDEVTAAMLVVEDLGRSHVKIGDIPKSEAGIVSFFGKIMFFSKFCYIFCEFYKFTFNFCVHNKSSIFC